MGFPRMGGALGTSGIFGDCQKAPDLLFVSRAPRPESKAGEAVPGGRMPA